MKDYQVYWYSKYNTLFLHTYGINIALNQITHGFVEYYLSNHFGFFFRSKDSFSTYYSLSLKKATISFEVSY